MIPRAQKSPIPLDDCHLAKAIEILGDRWTLLILRGALFGVRRFDDFQKELNIPRTVLSGRLKKLVDHGILTKQAYKEDGKRARPEYLLSDAGEALRPVLMGLNQWGGAWASDGTAPPISLTHSKTRQKVRPAFVDEDGRETKLSELRISLRR
ncbi:MAG: helix-turn-helix transcriptional regulator [Henriciella sp.]|jgi:DNA-binding HxlR family transcriptional regulator|nr:helix-turn-helix transcriptional regulator [Henriciella sp.]